MAAHKKKGSTLAEQPCPHWQAARYYLHPALTFTDLRCRFWLGGIACARYDMDTCPSRGKKILEAADASDQTYC